MIPYSFHPEAEVDLEEAASFYEGRLAGLARVFNAEVARAIALVCEYPELGSSVGRSRRAIQVQRFPYSVIYRRDPDGLRVLAVAHQRRRPAYWRRRK